MVLCMKIIKTIFVTWTLLQFSLNQAKDSGIRKKKNQKFHKIFSWKILIFEFDKSRQGKHKLHILPAMGQLLVLAAKYDEKEEQEWIFLRRKKLKYCQKLSESKVIHYLTWTSWKTVLYLELYCSPMSK